MNRSGDKVTDTINKLQLIGKHVLEANDWGVVFEEPNGLKGYIDTTNNHTSSQYIDFMLLKYFFLGRKNTNCGIKWDVIVRGGKLDIAKTQNTFFIAAELIDADRPVLAFRNGSSTSVYLINFKGKQKVIEMHGVKGRLELISNTDETYSLRETVYGVTKNGMEYVPIKALITFDVDLNIQGETNLEDKMYTLAKYIMFTSGLTKQQIDNKLDELGLQFRRNKGVKDIIKAIQKARDPKNGHYRTELELDMLRVYLEKRHR